ncbi:hypothetical protein A2Z67_01835 [Candidatus Woesebacteria bacterium RBG_13_36_22]|uniref:histidine kinase n=1 Tax=Candidatus Woesebacteria bacterium RBG_13_36_22 TaxID=1802478 RepID=A0A1F7X121_9BACT|nr:MAG: hypothetical protein A2Z67_01835 [Candidatus Woesebacteria bacterium RBG_13_36_22]
MIAAKLSEKIKSFGRLGYIIYPIVILICIPILLIINTAWNLKTFNRDVNFLIRHQAVSVAETIKPIVLDNISDIEKLREILIKTANSNSDIVDISILSENNQEIDLLVSSSGNYSQDDFKNLGLSQLSIGLNESFAGLGYDPIAGKNLWNVSVPLEKIEGGNYIVFLKFGVDKVDEILQRTSKDSYMILSILVIVALALLVNHFIFYQKAQKTRQLEEVDKLKDEFLSMAAHELRTPITALVGYLVLLQKKISPEEAQKIASDIALLQSLTNDLRNLIEDLLDVSRIEQGRLTYEVADVDVNKVIGDVVATLFPSAQEKGLAINYQAQSLPIVKADHNRLRQVVTNLLGNSVKYTLEGSIEVKAKKEDKFIEVSVKDTGIGIPPNELPKLFSKFHRVQDKKTESARGTGLGLWITKQIVEQMGGKMSVESIYGTGSRFSFTIPLRS